MDGELMDKEVLCILDTRQIQRYIFRSNSMFETVGASNLLTHILQDALLYSLNHIDPPVPEEEYDLSLDENARIPYFADPRVQFQLMTCTAGNAMFIARTGALAQKIIRKVSRYYLDHGRMLDVAAAAVERTDDLDQDLSRMYRKLDAVKASSETLAPAGTLPVCMRERRTGEPVLDFDRITGEPLSRASVQKREEAAMRSGLVRLEDIHTTTGHDGKEYRAVIHADGNNIGITVQKILKEALDYEAGIRFRRRVINNIEQTIAGVMERSIKQLKDYYQEVTGKTDGFEKEFQVVGRAGDDINCICNAIWAFPFLKLFYRNLKGAVIWKSETMETPFFACGGVAFVTADNAFHPAFFLAEDCCSNAKKVAKKKENLRNGLAGNWVDFQVLDNPNSQNLEVLRERFYMTSERISLLMRPYSLDPEAEETEISFSRLMDRVRTIRTLQLSPFQEAAFRQSYLSGKSEFRRFLFYMKKKGIDLTGLLGDPLYTDGDKQLHAAWFDAAELTDFIPFDRGRTDSCTE